MIETQFKNRELYNEMKKYAIYSSDITMVCAFRDELADLLISENVEFNYDKDHKETDNKEKPILTIEGKNIMKLINAPAEMLHFVGVRSEFDPTIPIRFMDEVSKLVDNNLIKTDEKFNKLYSHLSYNSKVNDLVCANVKFYGKGKLTDYLDGNSTLRSLNVSEHKETPVMYKQMSLKVMEPIQEKDRTSYITCKLINEIPERKVILQFYNPTILLRSIAFRGNLINISTTKVIENNDESFTIINPIILPNGLNLTDDVSISPKSRSVPADLWRNAYYEFMYRYNH